jgi:hypothetical protein
MTKTKSFLLVALLLASTRASAIKVETGNPDLNLNISVLLQVRYEGDWGGTPYNLSSPTGHYNNDFFVRRARLITSGNAYKYFTFYIMLDSPRFGARGNYGGSTGTTFVQDLYVGYVPVPDVTIEAGFLYMPLSHGSLASNSQINAVEGPGDILFYPLSRGSREVGVQLRGLFFDKRILLRGGVYEGNRQVTAPTGTPPPPPINPQGTPEVAGMIRYNFAGDETGYSYPTLYYDGKTRISVGVGAQYQPHSGSLNTVDRTYYDYLALAADVFADVALPDDQEASFTLGLYRSDWGPNQRNTGNALHGELGYRIGPIGPQVNVLWFNSDPKPNSSFKAAGGVNYYFSKHNAKLQLEVGSNTPNGVLNATPAQKYVILQAQAAF